VGARLSEGRTIRWGILGTGSVARLFARDLSRVPGAEAHAVASRSSERADTFARRLGLARAYGDAAALLADPAVDVVYVATPPAHHARHALQCLAAGKPVLCEKPFATHAAEARQVVERARTQGLFCMEAMWMRFVPALREALRQVERGAIGRVRMLLADFGVPTPESPGSTRFDPELGGGALLDRAVYPLSLAFALLGRPDRLRAEATLAGSGVDEHVGLVLRWPGGELACLAASLSGYLSNEAVIVGSEGRLRLHEPLCRPDRLTLTAAPAPAAEGPGSGLRERLRESRAFGWLRSRLPVGGSRARVLRLPCTGHGYHYEAAEVVRCLREGRSESPVMPLDESLAIVETLDAVRGELGRGVG